MKLADRLQGVLPSATLAMAARAKALKASGKQVIDMSVGEPDADTPETVKNAAMAALAKGDTKYTAVAGTPELKAAIAKHEGHRYGRSFASDEVIVCAGGKQVLFNTLACLINPGDEVIVPAPYWVSYPDMVRFCGGTPVAVVSSAGEGRLALAKDIERALTPKTKVVILNSPSNPTSAVYSQPEIDDLVALIRRHPSLVVITDDIYADMVFDAPFCSVAHKSSEFADRLLIASGVSKSYAMTGWRIGYGIGPKPLISAMARLQGASTSAPASVSQAAALFALQNESGFVERMREVFKKRRDRIVDRLNTLADISFVPPGGAFYIFVKLDRHYNAKVQNSQSMCEHLLDAVHLAAVPGDAFGSDSHIRLSFACSDAAIDEGVRRLGEGLALLRTSAG